MRMLKEIVDVLVPLLGPGDPTGSLALGVSWCRLLSLVRVRSQGSSLQACTCDKVELYVKDSGKNNMPRSGDVMVRMMVIVAQFQVLGIPSEVRCALHFAVCHGLVQLGGGLRVFSL